jgi:uncharacterized protein (UPF0305 family)
MPNFLQSILNKNNQINDIVKSRVFLLKHAQYVPVKISKYFK